jgi:hypothetical protein
MSGGRRFNKRRRRERGRGEGGGTKCQNIDIKLVGYIVTLPAPDITEWKIKTEQ